MTERTNFPRARLLRARAGAAPGLLPASLLAAVLILITSPAGAAGQAGGHILFGDLKVDESKVEGFTPLSFDVLLYSEGGTLMGRQTVTNNGRYRFLNVSNGRYDVAVEVEGTEVARVRVWVQYAYKTDHRQDLNFEWHARAPAGRAQTVSAADFYKRTPPNKSLFERAQRALDARRYDEAESLLGRLLEADAADFQAWTELGTAHLMRGDAGEAEKAYRRAVRERPNFTLALLNLGRLLTAQNRYGEAVAPLAKAAQSRPDSADANYLLGETYLQLKRGSKAVPHFNEALRLDPRGKAEAHLRLAALYNAAGYKGRAADEYRQFLAKRPKHPERKRLERYIAENRRP